MPPTFEIIVTFNYTQKRSLDLVDQIKPLTERGTQFYAVFIGKIRFLGGLQFIDGVCNAEAQSRPIKSAI
jgi:hypothetical protein